MNYQKGSFDLSHIFPEINQHLDESLHNSIQYSAAVSIIAQSVIQTEQILNIYGYHQSMETGLT